mgnify:CR=1 FL=1
MLVWHYNCKSGDAAYHENMVIKKFFDKNGIEIPYNKLDLYVKNNLNIQKMRNKNNI